MIFLGYLAPGSSSEGSCYIKHVRVLIVKRHRQVCVGGVGSQREHMNRFLGAEQSEMPASLKKPVEKQREDRLPDFGFSCFGSPASREPALVRGCHRLHGSVFALCQLRGGRGVRASFPKAAAGQVDAPGGCACSCERAAERLCPLSSSSVMTAFQHACPCTHRKDTFVSFSL